MLDCIIYDISKNRIKDVDIKVKLDVFRAVIYKLNRFFISLKK